MYLFATVFTLFEPIVTARNRLRLLFFKFDWHLIALFSDAHARGGSNSVPVIYKTGFGAKRSLALGRRVSGSVGGQFVENPYFGKGTIGS